jgi:hypothetical protein
MLPQAILSGIPANKYWTFTFGEIIDTIQAVNNKRQEEAKEQIAKDYNMATMISSFVSYRLNGKQIPKLNELYPGLFQEQQQEDNWQIQKEMMIDYAIRVNKQRSKNKG